MKHLTLISICILAFCGYLNDSKPIDKMNQKFHFFTVKDFDKMVLIYNEPVFTKQEFFCDTFYSYKQSDDIYLFKLCDNITLEVKLKRCWHLLKPLWNTFIVSDTIEYWPIDTVRLIRHDTVMIYLGFNSAYVGPLAKMNSENENSIFSINIKDICADIKNKND